MLPHKSRCCIPFDTSKLNINTGLCQASLCARSAAVQDDASNSSSQGPEELTCGRGSIAFHNVVVDSLLTATKITFCSVALGFRTVHPKSSFCVYPAHVFFMAPSSIHPALCDLSLQKKCQKIIYQRSLL